MKGLHTNTTSRRDLFGSALAKAGESARRIQIAVAFFTDDRLIRAWSERSKSVLLLVRLGFPTNPDALRRILGIEGVQVKFVTDRRFHSKLYLFDNHLAFVGSSNLTRSAVATNQEVNVAIDAEDPRCDELVALFIEYWDAAEVLTDQALDQYERIYRRLATRMENDGREHQRAVVDEIGDIQIGNYVRPGTSKQKTQLETQLATYRDEYQAFLAAFRTVQRVYEEVGLRRWNDDELPLLLEIDRFVVWVREAHAPVDKWREPIALIGAERDDFIRELIAEWEHARWPAHDREAAPRWHREVRAVFVDQKTTMKAEFDELVHGLAQVHAFYDRLRFFKGGHDTHVKAFKAANDVDRVRRTLSYLLFGRDEYVERLCRTIYDPRWRLSEFGASAAQELLGRVNNDGIPVFNDRTLKALHWLGFDVKPRGG